MAMIIAGVLATVAVVASAIKDLRWAIGLLSAAVAAIAWGLP